MHYPRPKNFRPALEVTRAQFSDTPPPFLHRPPRRGRKRQGILYQQRAGEMLERRYGEQLIHEPWIIFTDSHAAHRWCQPDFLLVDVRRGRLTIIEAKYQHCSEAYYQLFELYLPVLRHMFPAALWEIACVELCKWFDPTMPVPTPPVLQERIHDVKLNSFCVHIWKP